jgi:hypothetical protein
VQAHKLVHRACGLHTFTHTYLFHRACGLHTFLDCISTRSLIKVPSESTASCNPCVSKLPVQLEIPSGSTASRNALVSNFSSAASLAPAQPRARRHFQQLCRLMHEQHCSRTRNEFLGQQQESSVRRTRR